MGGRCRIWHLFLYKPTPLCILPVYYGVLGPFSFLIIYCSVYLSNIYIYICYVILIINLRHEYRKKMEHGLFFHIKIKFYFEFNILFKDNISFTFNNIYD